MIKAFRRNMAQGIARKRGFSEISDDNIVEIYRLIFRDICSGSLMLRPLYNGEAKAILCYAADNEACGNAIKEAVPQVFDAFVHDSVFDAGAILLKHTRPHPDLRRELPIGKAIKYMSNLVASEQFALANKVLRSEPVLQEALQSRPDILDPIRNNASMFASLFHPR